MSPNARRRLAVFIAGGAAFVDMYCTQALLPELARHFQASPADVGMTITMSTLATALSAPILGGLADMIGRKRVIVAGAVLLVLPTLGIALASTLPMVLTMRFLQGLCLPAVFTVIVAYVGEEYAPGDIPAVLGLYTSGSALGGVSGRLLVAVVADHWGWRDAFIALGCLNLAAALAIWVMLPTERNFRRSGSLGETLGNFWLHMRNPQLLATCGVGFALLFSLVGTFTYATFYLAGAPFHLGTAGQGFSFLVYLAGAAAAPLGGKLIARIGRVRGLGVGLAIAICGLILTLVPALPTVIIGLALMTVGVFMGQTASMSTVNASARQARSAAVGFYVTCYYLGGSLGGVAPGLAWSHAGWPGSVSMIILILLAGGTLAVRFWPRPSGGGSEAAAAAAGE